jgi:hypothetical protein
LSTPCFVRPRKGPWPRGMCMFIHLAIALAQVQDQSAAAAAEFVAAAPGTAIDWMRRLTAAPAASLWHQGSYQWASQHHEQTSAVLNRAASGEVITIATVGGSSSAHRTNYGDHLATGLRTLLHEAGYLNATIRVLNPSQVRHCPRACFPLAYYPPRYLKCCRAAQARTGRRRSCSRCCRQLWTSCFGK